MRSDDSDITSLMEHTVSTGLPEALTTNFATILKGKVKWFRVFYIKSNCVLKFFFAYSII